MSCKKGLIYLIDMDGTIYHGITPIPHAKEFIQYLNKNGRKYLMVTNCPYNSSTDLAGKLMGMDIDVNEENILTSGQLTAAFLSGKSFAQKVYLIGSEALEKELIKRNIQTVQENPDCVVVGYDKDFTYEKMKIAAQHILQGAKFVCTNYDYTIPDGDKLVPHTGSIAKSIEAATGIKPIIIGKPESHFIDVVTQIMNCSKNDCCIIGDRLDTDIALGVKNNIISYLVLTGVTSLEALNSSTIQPTRAFNNLYEIMLYDESMCSDNP